jgi:hypothetical protein
VRAALAVLVGLLGLAALPAAIALAEVSERVELLHATAAIPVAALFGLGALLLGRSARRRIDLTIGRVGGRRTAWTGRVLGGLALAAASSAAVAVATYVVLGRLAD